MGEIKACNVDIVKRSCARELCNYINRIDHLTKIEQLHFLVMIVQYIFSKFYTRGTLHNNSYYVYPKNIEGLFARDGFPGYITILVNYRNALCHEYGTPTEEFYLNEFVHIKHRLNDFLLYVLSDEECLHNYIIQQYCDKHNIVDKAQFEEEMNRLAKLCGSTDKKNVAFFIKDNLL